MNLLIITNLYPNQEKPQYGTFVKEQVDSLKKNYSDDMQIEVYFINSSKSILNYIKALIILPLMIKKKNVDLVHVHYGLTLVSTLFICVPIVVTFHGTDLAYWPVKIISKLLSFKAARKIVVSNNMKKIMPKAEVIPCGINMDLFSSTTYNMKKHLMRYESLNRLKILFPSSPKNKVKNYPLFKEICEELTTRGYKIEEIHLFNIEREQISKIFNDSDIMLLTSRREGSPTVIKEAIAAKLPFVSVDVGDVKEWTKLINFGVVTESLNAVQIADTIMKHLNHLSKLKCLDNSKAIKDINADTIAKNLKRLYENEMKRKSRRI